MEVNKIINDIFRIVLNIIFITIVILFSVFAYTSVHTWIFVVLYQPQQCLQHH